MAAPGIIRLLPTDFIKSIKLCESKASSQSDVIVMLIKLTDGLF